MSKSRNLCKVRIYRWILCFYTKHHETMFYWLLRKRVPAGESAEVRSEVFPRLQVLY